eukprot:TRINITY_DN11860_c0_g1_i1.p1 TRINITY_DN11860_c0_g1~~TRINITY_DN11860_c0_g1_i1.p1  ORF type:complete len:291 (-),score=73.36 TRINITY_DN11860_c0_g1_i1:263-1135(-)
MWVTVVMVVVLLLVLRWLFKALTELRKRSPNKNSSSNTTPKSQQTSTTSSTNAAAGDASAKKVPQTTTQAPAALVKQASLPSQLQQQTQSEDTSSPSRKHLLKQQSSSSMLSNQSSKSSSSASASSSSTSGSSSPSTIGNIGNWVCKSPHTISSDFYVLYVIEEGQKYYLTKSAGNPVITTDTDESRALRLRKHLCTATENVHWVTDDDQHSLRYGRHRGISQLSLQLEKRPPGREGHWDTWQRFNSGEGHVYYSISNDSHLRYKPKHKRFDPTSKLLHAVTIYEQVVAS